MKTVLILNFFLRKIRNNFKQMKQSETKITVRYFETDQMGVVHHSNFIKYFEIARIDWLNKLNISYKKMEQEGIILPVIALNCNYKKSAFFDDELTIITEIASIPSVKIDFNYTIYNQKKELVTTGNTVLAFLNKETKKPIRCPEYILKAISD